MNKILLTLMTMASLSLTACYPVFVTNPMPYTTTTVTSIVNQQPIPPAVVEYVDRPLVIYREEPAPIIDLRDVRYLFSRHHRHHGGGHHGGHHR